ncbi:MAG: DUF2520 domain-containing protein, partial [Candidatus Limnocylindrales bacterium]
MPRSGCRRRGPIPALRHPAGRSCERASGRCTGATAGLDEPGALAVYGRLIEQTLANARGIGVAASLTGPITRGDGGTLEA